MFIVCFLTANILFQMIVNNMKLNDVDNLKTKVKATESCNDFDLLIPVIATLSIACAHTCYSLLHNTQIDLTRSMIS